MQPPVDGRVGAKRRRTEDPPRGRWISFPPLPAEGLTRYIWRTCVASPARSFLGRIQEAMRPDVVWADVPHDALYLVFQRLDLQSILRCSMSCKLFESVIKSEGFRASFRASTVDTAPIVAIIAHPHSSTVPVAIPPGSPFQNINFSLPYADSYKYIADVRDGYVLLYNSPTTQYQQFLLVNPLLHVTREIAKPPYNPLHLYVSAGFIPSEDSFDYGIIVLYAHTTGDPREMSTSRFDSRKGSWQTTGHTLDRPGPKCRFDITLPSVLIARKWSILMTGSCVLTVEMIPPPSTPPHPSRPAPMVTVRMTTIPIPITSEEARWHNRIGKDGLQLCFILAQADGLQVWRRNLSYPLANSLWTPRYHALGPGLHGLQTPLGFAEANTSVIVQPEILLDGHIIIMNISSSVQEPMNKEGTDHHLFAYELQWPPIRPKPSSARD